MSTVDPTKEKSEPMEIDPGDSSASNHIVPSQKNKSSADQKQPLPSGQHLNEKKSDPHVQSAPSANAVASTKVIPHSHEQPSAPISTSNGASKVSVKNSPLSNPQAKSKTVGTSAEQKHLPASSQIDQLEEDMDPMQENNQDENKKLEAYSRKEKSLGILCENFIALFQSIEGHEVALDSAAAQLKIERRRIYDIVNVLESVGMVERKAKNSYSWRGDSGFQKTLAFLNEHASEFLEQRKNGIPEADGESSRKVKSMGILSQNFCQLFMASAHSTVTLEDAAASLLGKTDDLKNMKTKIRRLYDIANILCAINLIEKTQSQDNKPAFRWLGPSKTDLAAIKDVQDVSRFNLNNPKQKSTAKEKKDKRLSSASASKPVSGPKKKTRLDSTPQENPDPMGLDANRATWAQVFERLYGKDNSSNKDAGSLSSSTMSFVDPKDCPINPYSWSDKSRVDEYLEKAKQAGEAQYEKAKEWHEKLLEWHRLWKAWINALTDKEPTDAYEKSTVHLSDEQRVHAALAMFAAAATATIENESGILSVEDK